MRVRNNPIVTKKEVQKKKNNASNKEEIEKARIECSPKLWENCGVSELFQRTVRIKI